MCGFLVFIAKKKLPNTETFKKSLQLQNHRGPANLKIIELKEANAIIGAIRLPINDDAVRSDQPLKFKDKYFTFTGELYNYLEIKKMLFEDGFKCDDLHGDTQVFAAAISYWGIEKSLEKFRGMYAAVYYNSSEENFYIIRDRLGIKPLYVYKDENCIIYSTEIKSIQYLKKK